MDISPCTDFDLPTFPPIITTQPQSVRVDYGQPAILHCQAGGTNITYDWWVCTSTDMSAWCFKILPIPVLSVRSSASFSRHEKMKEKGREGGRE